MRYRSGIFCLILALLLLLPACDLSPSTGENSRNNGSETLSSADSAGESAEQPPVQSFAAADIQGIDPYDPNLTIADVDFSQQPHFTSEEGVDAFWRDCLAHRYRSIVFSCDKSVQIDINAKSFCEDYQVAWVIPKMQPGGAGKQYILRTGNQPH